jgi:catechol 2,3-dioxygenase-like lactoylglutathione lyase family enzyme
MKSKFPCAVPEIPVSDINKAVAYYKDNLGFKVDWGDEELGLAGVSRENCRMFLDKGVNLPRKNLKFEL